MTSTKPKNLIILTTPSDISAPRIEKEAKKSGFKTYFLDYSELFQESLPQVALPCSGSDTILLARYPYTANNIQQNYVSLLNHIIRKFEFRKVFDSKLYQKSFIEYEDKYQQCLVFEELQLKYAKMFSPKNKKGTNFPIIAKKRVSSRSKSNFIIDNHEKLKKFTSSYDTSQYIFQKFHPLINDYRVLILNGKCIGTVKRRVNIDQNKKISIKVDSLANLPNKIINDCIRVTSHIGCDFCGIDIGEKEDGKLFFIEYNPSPQFLGFERETGINVARKIIDSLIVQKLHITNPT